MKLLLPMALLPMALLPMALLPMALLLWPGLAPAQGLVLGDTAPQPQQGCIGVTASNAISYGCINDQEKALVARQQAGMAASRPGPASAPPALGLYNQAATREQFGTNFGKSTIPQRPPPAVYSTPVMPHS